MSKRGLGLLIFCLYVLILLVSSIWHSFRTRPPRGVPAVYGRLEAAVREYQVRHGHPPRDLTEIPDLSEHHRIERGSEPAQYRIGRYLVHYQVSDGDFELKLLGLSPQPKPIGLRFWFSVVYWCVGLAIFAVFKKAQER
jgi:hypothetical protein